MSARLTEHGLGRAQERVGLSVEQVLAILDEGKFVPLGSETGTSREHRLFYSIPDDCCFVAVQDVKYHEVVTVLPIKYHNRWRISVEAEAQAKALITGCRIIALQSEAPPTRIVRVFAWRNDRASRVMMFVGKLAVDRRLDLALESTWPPDFKQRVESLIRSRMGIFVPDQAFARTGRGKLSFASSRKPPQGNTCGFYFRRIFGIIIGINSLEKCKRKFPSGRNLCSTRSCRLL